MLESPPATARRSMSFCASRRTQVSLAARRPATLGRPPQFIGDVWVWFDVQANLNS